jgi:putative Holliday junction resolvase
VHYVQDDQPTKNNESDPISKLPDEGRIIALDPGTKRIGVAVCDELRITTRPLPMIARTSWKTSLKKIEDLLAELDAVAVVVGLPYNFDGSDTHMTSEAANIARKLRLSLPVPVFQQDERATSYEAKGRLWAQGADDRQVRDSVDSEAAAIILADFLDRVLSEDKK